MRFPDRPIATAGLGIAFALILLGILSYPAFIESSLAPSSATELTTTQGLSSSQSSAPAQYGAGSDLESSNVSTFVSTTTVMHTVNSATATISSATGAQPSSETNASIPNSVTGVQSETTATVANSLTTSGTTIVSSSSALPLTSSQSQQSYSVSAGTSNASASTSQLLNLFVELSIVSLVIAAGSMLLISRRLNSEGNVET